MIDECSVLAHGHDSVDFGHFLRRRGRRRSWEERWNGARHDPSVVGTRRVAAKTQTRDSDIRTCDEERRTLVNVCAVNQRPVNETSTSASKRDARSQRSGRLVGDADGDVRRYLNDRPPVALSERRVEVAEALNHSKTRGRPDGSETRAFKPKYSASVVSCRARTKGVLSMLRP